MQDRPTAAELLKVAQEFCEKDLMPNTEGRVRFHVRVLQNVLGILEREWAGEEDAVNAEWGRLKTLIDADAEQPDTFGATKDQVRAWNVVLSQRIRAGELDDRFDETVAALSDTIEAKLRIANPRYF
ncbi:MAG: DUF6285 domain-containing protein [Actinomycetota bacterium]